MTSYVFLPLYSLFFTLSIVKVFEISWMYICKKDSVGLKFLKALLSQNIPSLAAQSPQRLYTCHLYDIWHLPWYISK